MVFFVAALTASSAGTFVVGTIVAVPSCTSHLSAFLATERSILTTSVPVSFGPLPVQFFHSALLLAW